MSSTKLKSLERKLNLVPKQYPAMSPGMERLARQQDRYAPEQAPAPAPDLGATLDALIQQRVDEALAVERERHAAQMQQLKEQVNHVRQLPPAKKGPMPATETTWHRDGAGRIAWAETVDGNGNRFMTKAERDAAGAIVRLKTVPTGEESPVLPALETPYKAEAREYMPGIPRKLYGNTPPEA